MKICIKCNKQLSKDMFYRTDSRCKSCKKDYNKAYNKKRKQLTNYYKW